LLYVRHRKLTHNDHDDDHNDDDDEMLSLDVDTGLFSFTDNWTTIVDHVWEEDADNQIQNTHAPMQIQIQNT